MNISFNSSREMSTRNAIFREVFADLNKGYGVEPEEARKMAQRAISENRADRKKGGSHQHGSGGQSGLTNPVTITDDSCLGVDPLCDSNTPFRTISGQCNNLGNPYLGAMSTAFSREIGIGDYNPKVDLTIYLDKYQS